MIKNKKGFTLVELLAVIVILAIIMIIAIPSVISTMTVAKKKSMVDLAYKILNKAKEKYVEDELNGLSYPLPAEKNFIIYDIRKDLGLNTGSYYGYVAYVVSLGEYDSSWYELNFFDDEYMLGYDEYAGMLDSSKKEITTENIGSSRDFINYFEEEGVDLKEVDVVEFEGYNVLHTTCADQTQAVIRGATRQQVFNTNYNAHDCSEREKNEEAYKMLEDLREKLSKTQSLSN